MNPERAFLRTLTPPPRSPHSSSSSSSSDSSVDSAAKWPPEENTTGCEYDADDDLWRCIHCRWEIETFDGVQGHCVNGHQVGCWSNLLFVCVVCFDRLCFGKSFPISTTYYSLFPNLPPHQSTHPRTRFFPTFLLIIIKSTHFTTIKNPTPTHLC